MGSDAANLQTRAVRDGDDYVLNGEKVYISGGTVADFCTVFADGPAAGSRGISAFIVPTDTPGFTIDRTDRKMGVNGVPTAHFALQDVRVPAENLLGGVEGTRLQPRDAGAQLLRPTVGARGLGLAEGALAYALEFARKRKAFGGPIADFQAIQFMFADMAIEIEAARCLVYQAAWMVDQGKYKREYAALPLDREGVRDRDGEQGRLGRAPGAGRAGLHEGPPAGAPLPRRPPADDRRRHEPGAARGHLAGAARPDLVYG